MSRSSGRTHWINGSLLRDARIRAGKSMRQVERETGLSFMLLNGIEKHSSIGGQLTLAELARLARSLGLEAHALIAPKDAFAPRPFDKLADFD
jgi:transcriptional regulator with XRE-family HTH domain